jgi:hypothetical protein
MASNSTSSWQKTETYSHYQFNHLPPAEHLRLAQEICRSKQLKTVCADPYTATPHLNKIPRDAAEYNEAQKLLGVIQSQAQIAAERERQTMAAREAERTRLENQTQQESLEQMQRNIAGTVHDSYKCATSTVGTAIVSFDNGHYWWSDDGRCAAEDQKDTLIRHCAEV